MFYFAGFNINFDEFVSNVKERKIDIKERLENIHYVNMLIVLIYFYFIHSACRRMKCKIRESTLDMVEICME